MDEDYQLGEEEGVVDDVIDYLEPSVKAVQGSVKMEQLCESLNIEEVGLRQEEQSKLAELVEKYSELFALVVQNWDVHHLLNNPLTQVTTHQLNSYQGEYLTF